MINSKVLKIFIITISIAIVVMAVRFAVSRYDQYKQQSDFAQKRTTDSLLEKADQHLKAYPNDPGSYTALASVYLQKIRETSDTSYYLKIDDLMLKAEQIDPKNADVISIEAAVAEGRHDFSKGLSLGTKALSLVSSVARYYGIVGDAQVELGKYPEAILSFQKMVDTRPDLNSFSRVAYIRELFGQIPGAITGMQSAISAGGFFSENTAWAYSELGRLYFRYNLDQAEKQYNNALSLVPDFAPAFQGFGRIEYARGHLDKSLEYFQKAFDKVPVPQYATDLSDIFLKMRNQAKADQYYELAKITYDQGSKNGVNNDLELSRFLLDHDKDIDTALQKAQSAYQTRPSIFGADVLAWAYYKKQNYKEADRYIKLALRIGTQDPIIYTHAALIYQAENQKAKAKEAIQKAFPINPFTSILYVDLIKSTQLNLK